MPRSTAPSSSLRSRSTSKDINPACFSIGKKSSSEVLSSRRRVMKKRPPESVAGNEHWTRRARHAVGTG